MFWRKLILINMVTIYLAIKIYGFVWFCLGRPDNEDFSITSIYDNINCNMTSIYEMNQIISPKFDQIRSTLFFKIFRVNFDSGCNFWTQNMICNFHTCSVCQCEDEEVPLPWMQDSENDDVDKNIGEKFYRWVEKYNYSSPHWLVENEIDSKNGIFVNLEKNPESYTGYQGQKIWNAIYYENCFKNDFIHFEQLCKEEQTFFKIISGLHTNINIHLSKNYLDITNNRSLFNHSMLNERVLKHPERINNLMFLYSLLLKAFYKAENIIKNYNFFTGNKFEDNATINYFQEIYNKSNSFTQGREFCTNCLTKELSLTNENFDKFFNFNQFKIDELKMKFRNISQIIDCVGCQKCKLHGKLQIYGLATMLKILFIKNDDNIINNLKLKRNEIISFINLVGKVSKAIHYLKENEKQEFINNLIGKNKFYIDDYIKAWNVIYTSLFVFLIIYLNKYFFNNRHELESKKFTRKNRKLEENKNN